MNDTIINGNEIKNNYIPFHSILSIITSTSIISVTLLQIGGNILMCMPLGFYIPLVSPKSNNIKRVIGVGFLFSLLIELTQLSISAFMGYNYRSVDVDDIILNITGVLLGYVIFLVIQPLLEKLFFELNFNPIENN